MFFFPTPHNSHHFGSKLKCYALLAYEFSWLSERIASLFISTPAATAVRSYSYNLLYTTITFFFRGIEHIQRLSADNKKIFPKNVLVLSLRSGFIDSFSFAKKCGSTFQGFHTFFVQSCDRFLFLFFLYFSFLILVYELLVEFLFII